jgi:hypothetical protein
MRDNNTISGVKLFFYVVSVFDSNLGRFGDFLAEVTTGSKKVVGKFMSGFRIKIKINQV